MCQSLPRAGGQQQAVQFGIQPLGADGVQCLPGGESSFGGGGIQRKAQLGGKPQRPQNAQRVLGKAVGRCADAPHDACRQIAATAVQINDALAGGVGHGVDGEIPPRQILGQIVHKLHAVGVAVVAVASV